MGVITNFWMYHYSEKKLLMGFSFWIQLNLKPELTVNSAITNEQKSFIGLQCQIKFFFFFFSKRVQV